MPNAAPVIIQRHFGLSKPVSPRVATRVIRSLKRKRRYNTLDTLEYMLFNALKRAR